MSTIPSAIIDRAAVTKRAGAFSRLFSAFWYRIARYFACRSAIKTLRELDDHALRDIGLVRSQIEPAVRGVINRFDRPRM